MNWRDRMFHEDGIPYLTCSHWGLFRDHSVEFIMACRDAKGQIHPAYAADYAWPVLSYDAKYLHG